MLHHIIIIPFILLWADEGSTPPSPSPAPAAPPVTINMPSPPTPPVPVPASRQNSVFSDKVFDSVGAEAKEVGEYNSAQREAWLVACQQYQGVDSQKYRECYQQEKKKTLDENRRSIEAMEKKQQKGELPLPTDKLLRRLPADEKN